MKRKILFLLAVTLVIGLIGCGNKTNNTMSVNAEPMAEVTEPETEPETIEEGDPEPEPVEEEEPEEEEDKPLDLDSHANLKWAMDGFVNCFNYDYSDFCSGEEDAVIGLLEYMCFYSFAEDHSNLPKGEAIDIDGDGYIRFTVEQAQEAVNSLTGHQVDIGSVGENGVIDLWGVNLIETDTVCKNWNTEYIGNNTWKVYVDKYRYGYEYYEDTLYKELEYTFTVTENPDSIFDGYSIIEVEEAKMSLEWAKAYYDYLLTDEEYEYYDEYYEFYLIYLDNDDIPEIYGRSYGFGENILIYYSDGQVKKKINNLTAMFQYIPKSGLLMEWTNINSYGAFSNIYQLTNGELATLIESQAELREEYRGEIENESWMYDYTLNGEAVSEEEYNRRLNEVFDTSKAINLWTYENNTLVLNTLLNMLSSQ